MPSNRERVTQYLAEHPGASVRAAARDLGVSYSTVSRVRATPNGATPATPTADIPDGWAWCAVNQDDAARLLADAKQLRKRNAELAAQLREYATGARPGMVLSEGKRYVYEDGELRPWVRSVQQRG